MEILIDDAGMNKNYRKILAQINAYKSGVTVDLMRDRGIKYKINWGDSIVSLRMIANHYEKNHLLALKLWNKGWRETMILATLLDPHDELTEQQMDYWTRSFETGEIAEQAVANFFVYSKFAFVKSLEYCCGKKPYVRYTGLLLLGRLAMVDKESIDDMFMPCFNVIAPLSKDSSLGDAFYRLILRLAHRSERLRVECIRFLEDVQKFEEEFPKKLAGSLLEELKDPEFE
ncbi:MAG: hypothetical protein JJE45_04885 [Prolixibacteraceae bacterium]|nr:hypothetical protein [Prolixibacteraceae bacterium]